MKIDVIQVEDKFVVRFRKTIFGYSIPLTTKFIDKDGTDWTNLQYVLKYAVFNTYKDACVIADLAKAIKEVSK